MIRNEVNKPATEVIDLQQPGKIVGGSNFGGLTVSNMGSSNRFNGSSASPFVYDVPNSFYVYIVCISINKGPAKSCSLLEA